MKILTHRAKWFLPFAFIVLLASGSIISCDSKDSSSIPTVTQQIPTDLSQTMAVQDRHTDELLAIDGVIGTGTGRHPDGSPAIYIFTTRDNVAGLPTMIEGIRTHIENTGVISAGIPNTLEDIHKGSAVPLAAGFTTQDRNPMHSGFSVGNDNECAAGTISCVVTNGITNYLLSNNHVFALSLIHI